jgi:hypothetical protein
MNQPSSSNDEEKIDNIAASVLLDTDLKELSTNFTQAALSFERDSQLSGLSETLNDCLASTDEFQTLTDLLNADTQVSLEVIKAFSEKCPQIESLFSRIDQLEDFVGKSKDALKNIEQAISKAESELNKK